MRGGEGCLVAWANGRGCLGLDLAAWEFQGSGTALEAGDLEEVMHPLPPTPTPDLA